MELAAAMTAVRDQLLAGGVRATIDPRDVNPPCVLVRPPTMSYRFGKNTWEAAFEGWVMVPSAGTAADLDAVGRILEATQAALGYVGVTATPDDATIADGSTVPMYRLTWSARIPA